MPDKAQINNLYKKLILKVMKTRPTTKMKKLLFPILCCLFLFSINEIYAQQYSSLKSTIDDENAVLKIDYENNDIGKTIITDNQQNQIENNDKTEIITSQSSYLKNLSTCDNSWQGGTNPSFSFELTNNSLITNLVINYSISLSDCSYKSTSTYPKRDIVNNEINIKSFNKFFNGFTMVSDTDELHGTFSKDMNSISGTYSLSTHGCGGRLSGNWTATPTPPVPTKPSAITGDTLVCRNSSNVTYTVPDISRATMYVWTLPSGATGTSTTNSISVNFENTAVSGNIIVKGSNDCGDGTESTLAITVNNNCNQNSIDNISSSNIVKVHPNPTTGPLEILINEPLKSEYSIKVFNSVGGLMQTVLKLENEKITQINLSDYPSGMYFIQIISKNKIYNSKIIKN
jgi:hypothetical protein